MAISKWVFRLSDGLYLRGGFYDPEFNPATEGVEEFPDADPHPDRRTQRAPGRRPATPAEIVAFDDAENTNRAGGFVDDKRQLATLIYLIKRLNELRQQPGTVFPVLTPAAVRQGIIDEFKALPG